MSIEEQSKTIDGYESTMKIVTVEPGGLTDNHSSKARIIINFGEHGRELISPEIALRLLDSLCDEQARKRLLIAYGMSLDIVDTVLHNVVFKIIPVENPRGRQLVESGALCERKNGRGVDPNRNWKVHWGFKEADYDPNEEFPGSKPFSEPEAAVLQNLAENFKPHVWLNVHSGMEAFFVPYDHKNEVPQGPAADATLAILHKLNKDLCSGACAVGPGGKTVGYLAHGTATDYMQDVLGVGVVMTWEVYGDDDASFEDCFRLFNPLTEEGYRRVVDQWTAAMFALVVALPGHPAIPELDALSKVLVDSFSDGGIGIDHVFKQKNEDKNTSSNKNTSTSSGSLKESGKESGNGGGGALGRKGGFEVINDSTLGIEDRSSKELIEERSNKLSINGKTVNGANPKNISGFVLLGIACVVFAVYVWSGGSRRGILGSLRMGRRRQAIPL